MESTAYFRKIYGSIPWNPLNFHGINSKNLWHFINFHNFLLLVYLPSSAMETFKTPSEYSVDLSADFMGFHGKSRDGGHTRALDKKCHLTIFPLECLFQIQYCFTEMFCMMPSTKIYQNVYSSAGQHGHQSKNRNIF